jgi:hypothetical protein
MNKCRYIVMVIPLLLAGSAGPGRVYGGTPAPTPTVVPVPLEIGHTVVGTVPGNETRDYVLNLTYERGGLTDDVVVLFTADHFAAVLGCSSYLITMEDGTTRGDRSCVGGGDGVPQEPPTSDVWFLVAHHLQPGEKSYQYTRIFRVVRPYAGSVSVSFKTYALSPEPITPGDTDEGTFTAATPFKAYKVSSFLAQDVITAYLEDTDPQGRFLWVRGGLLKWIRGDSAREDNFGQGIYALELQLADDNTCHLMAGGMGAYRFHVDHKPIQTAQLGSYDVTLSYEAPTDIRVLNGHKGDKFILTATGEELEIVVYQDQNPGKKDAGDTLAVFTYHPNHFGAVSREFALKNDEPVYIETLFPPVGSRDRLPVHLTLTRAPNQ